MPSIGKLESLELHYKLWTPTRVREPRLVMMGEGRNRTELLAMRSQVTALGPFDELEDLLAAIGAFATDCYEATLAASLLEPGAGPTDSAG